MNPGGLAVKAGMLERIAGSVIKWRRAVLAVAVLTVIGGGIFGINVGPHLSQGGFDGHPNRPPSPPTSCGVTSTPGLPT